MAMLLRGGLGLGVTLASLLLALALGLGLLLVGRTVTAPSWITARVEAQAGEMLGGGSLDFGAIALTLGHDLHPELRLRDTVLRDARGAVLARVPRIEARLSPRGLALRGAPLVQEVVLHRPEIGLGRDAAGRIEVSFERPAPVAAPQPPDAAPGVGGLLARIDALLDRPALAALERIAFEEMTLAYADARAGRDWRAEGARLDVDLRRGTRIAGAMVLRGAAGTAIDLALDYTHAPGAGEARLDLRIDGAPSRDIATQHPALGFLSALDAPLSARLVGRLGANGAPGPVSAVLRIGKGALAPGPGAAPIGFDAAELALRFDPDTGRIDLDRIAASGDLGAMRGQGQVQLGEMRGARPATLAAQIGIDALTLLPPSGLPAPARLTDIRAELRLDSAPFALEIDSFGATDAESGARIEGAGRLGYAPAGWKAALDARTARLPRDRLLGWWPEAFKPRTRDWVESRITQAELHDAALRLRRDPGAPPEVTLEHGFAGTTLRPIDGMPPITGAAGRLRLGDGALSVALRAGSTTPPQGGRIDLAGSRFEIPALGGPRPDARIAIAAAGPVTAMLSLADQPPLRLLQKAGQPVELIAGQGRAKIDIGLPLGGPVTPEEIAWSLTGGIEAARSDRLVPGRALAAPALDVAITPAALDVTGPVTIDGLPAEIALTKPLGAGAGPARLEGTVELSQRFLDTFGIALPARSLTGTGAARLAMTLPEGRAPAITLSSDLDGVGLEIPALGWSLAPGTTGRVEIAGMLGARPHVDRIALDAGGLSARGGLTLRPEGGLDRASFSRLRLSDWLDISADLVGRGPGATVGVEVTGGALDLRRASFGAGGGAGAGGPVAIALDRLRVTQAVALTGFRGDFSTMGGFSGRFDARVNGAAPVAGLVVPDRGGAAVRITAQDAGAVMRAAGLYGTATGGVLDLTLLPEGAPGHYGGSLDLRGLRVRDAPAMAQLLDAISVVGLLQQLDGKGLAFDRIAADFRLTPETLDIARASATGPGLGISLDGRYSLASRRMAFRGVVSPFYLINSLGSFLTRPGEGLIGFNYTLGGTPEAPDVSVNPLSALTPGLFRELFRQAPPT